MQRRHFLLLFSRTIYAGCGAITAAAIGRFLAAPSASKDSSRGEQRIRVATLDSLPVGEPKLIPVEGTRHNAWVKSPSEVIGKVWMTRLGSAETPPADTKLLVFNASCPHNGCPIQKATKKGFACHCHGARFTPRGKLVPSTPEYTNPAPRGMDPLEHQLVQDTKSGAWWVEVDFQNFETGLSQRVVIG